MRRRLLAVLCCALALAAGCSNRLSQEDAGEALRAEYPPAPVMDWANGEEFLSRLAADGLVRFTPGDFLKQVSAQLALTEQGQALGLEVLEDTFPGTDWVDRRLRFKLCDLVFDTVSGLTEVQQEPVQATEARYVRRYGNHTDFFGWLESHDMPSRECARDTTFAGRAVFLRGEEGWALNRRPAFPDSIGAEINTSFEYDNVGLLTGAVTRMKVGAGPADPDGDPLTLTWSGWYASDDGQADVELQVDGAEAAWRRLISWGEPVGGVVFYVATDAWGNADTVRFCIEGAGFRC